MARTRSPKPTAGAPAAVDRWHLDDNVAHLMSRVVNRLNAQLLEHLRKHELTNQHYRIMQILYDEDGITIGEMCRRAVIAQPVLSRILTQMEERDLLQRRQDKADSRFRLIRLTPVGRATYERVWPIARSILDAATDGFDRNERSRLVELLGKLDRHVNGD